MSRDLIDEKVFRIYDLGIGNSRCKGFEVVWGLICLRWSKEVIVGGVRVGREIGVGWV